jgi:uncharacterized protein YhfF
MTQKITQEIAVFVEQAKRSLPAHALDRFKVRTFGGGDQMGDVLIDLIARGEKTGTFALAVEFEGREADAPHVGDVYVVTRHDGTPKLIFRVEEVEIVPFGQISERHVAVEGPNIRNNLQGWRDIHWPYWTPLMRSKGREPSMDMPVIFHRFTLLYPPLP